MPFINGFVDVDVRLTIRAENEDNAYDYVVQMLGILQEIDVDILRDLRMIYPTAFSEDRYEQLYKYSIDNVQTREE